MAEFIYHKEQIVAVGDVVKIPEIDNLIKKNTVINPNDCGEIGGWEIDDIDKIEKQE